jgi:hypothetical protein
MNLHLSENFKSAGLVYLWEQTAMFRNWLTHHDVSESLHMLTFTCPAGNSCLILSVPLVGTETTVVWMLIWCPSGSVRIVIELFWGSSPLVGIQKCKTEASVSTVRANQPKAVEEKLLKRRCILNTQHNYSAMNQRLRASLYYTITLFLYYTGWSI